MAEPDDTGFELLPEDTLVLDPDDELAAVIAADDDDSLILEAEPNAGPRPYGKSLLFDVHSGSFVRHGDSPARIAGLDSMKMIVHIALHVARGAHASLPDEFGMDEPHRFIGRMIEPEEFGSYQQDIEETVLAAHERVSSLDEFWFRYEDDGDRLLVDFSVYTDEGEAFRIEEFTI
jgi:hypothetical protein